jgi:glutamate synthase domain-containing protein 2
VPSQHLSRRRGDAGPGAAPEVRGKPEHVVNYFFFVAQEMRELMAKLGVRRL